MDAFNEFMRNNGVEEMIRKGGKFTWTNKQLNPVLSVLDRVLVCPKWDEWYKKASCETLTRIGSDHCPLIVNTKDLRFKHTHSFRFETAWLTQEGFRDLVISNWPKRDGQNAKIYRTIGRKLKQQHGDFVKAGVRTLIVKFKKIRGVFWKK
jgi:hypothetical protein